MIRYFLYARKSTDEEDRQVLSIEAQLHEVREFAKKESLHVAEEFIESRTAKTPGRPIYNAMMARIEKGEAAGIVTWHPDRLARNSVDGGQIIYLVDTEKIQSLKFPTFWFDNTPQGKFMLNIAFGQSKYYVDNLRENILRGIRQKLRRGEYPGKPPIGYLNEPRLRTIVLDTERAPLVRRIFEMCATGRYSVATLRALADDLGLQTQRRTTPAISYLHRILADPFYIGFFRYDGQMYEGSHPPLVSKELFDTVQAVLRQRGRPRCKHRELFPFLGLLRCGECGYGITAERQKGHHYYRCTKKGNQCSQPYVREEALAGQLRDILLRVAPSDAWHEPIMQQLDTWEKEEAETAHATKRAIEETLAAVTLKLERLLDAHLDGTITREEYAARKEKLLTEKLDLNEKLAKLDKQGNLWLEPARRFFKQAFHAGEIACGENLDDIKGFFQTVGSNLTLKSRAVNAELKNFWSILVDFDRNSGWWAAQGSNL